MSKSRMKKFSLFKKFGKSTTDLSEWNKGDDKILKAVENGDISKVEAILQKKTINPTKLGIHGFSIFHVASRYGHLAIIEKLLEYGADVNCLTIQGSTALQLACGSGHVKIVDRLIKAGAEMNLKDGQQLTALHHACMGCYHECVQVLLANGADVSLGDQTGRTPLFFAALSGQVEICKDLLDKEANINSIENNQMTPLMGAANRGRKEVCELLLKKGANRDLTDVRGFTALQHAMEEKHKDIQEVFIKAPTIATWDVPGTTLDRKKKDIKGAEGGADTSEMPEADQVDIVANFVADTSPSPGPQRKEGTLQQAAQKTSSQPAVDQRALQAYKAGVPSKELEEENDQLNEELHKLRIQNIKNQDNITSLQIQLKEKSKETQEHELKMKELTESLETEMKKVETLQQNSQSLSISNTLTESTDDGIETDHWNDSEEDLFGSLKRGKKSSKDSDTDDKQLIALLRSQILTYQSENEQLKQKVTENKDGTSTGDQEMVQKMEVMSHQLSQLQKHRDDLQEQVAMYKMTNSTDECKACSAILDELMSPKYKNTVEPFCNHDNQSDLDLKVVQDNLNSGKYSSLDSFVSDVRLIITNSSQSEQLAEKGQELETIFNNIYSSVKGKVSNGTDKHVHAEDRSVTVNNELPVSSSGIQLEISNDKSEINELRTDYDQLKEQNNMLRQDLETLQSTYEKLVQAGDNLQDMYDQLLIEKDQQYNEMEKLAREKEEIVKENEFLLSEGNAMHDDLEKLVQELEDIQEKFKIVQGEKDDLERKLGSMNVPAKASEMAKIVEERDKFKDQCQELQTENERLKHDHEIVLEEVQSMQEQCNQLQTDNEQMTQDFETAQEEFDQLTQQHEGLQQDYNQLEQDYSELLADKEKLETEFLEVQTASVKEQNPLAEEETEELKQENEMLSYEKDQLEMTIKELSKNNALLEEKLERNRGELGKTLEKLKKEASLRVKHDTDANTDKEKQIKSLQVQVSRLQQQLAETDRRHMDIVNTYRTHLISAVQGHMDEDVQQALYNIIELRSMEEYC
ncbi:ankyrin repeat domain-containing protein 24-like isoform X1 [Mytilus californianus]|uniref:ankyrin repeat domain-containing protein 24-like isoform X1 n=1 Tax=Mytilus californianus TaxID=6549 RepID=UPI00224819DF|nr:ankyrin repeat domain-containing protein 24-like isoform X1 [Mytilus californianus]